MGTVDLNEIISDILVDFYMTFDLTPVDVKYSIVDDMEKAYAAIRPDYATAHPETVATANMYNGLTVMPETLDGAFDVLLNAKRMLTYLREENFTWVGTIVHETTHAIDYSEYANLVWIDSYEELQDIGRHAMFQLWTEFNARSKGYYFVRKYSFKDMRDMSQVKDIINHELPAQYERLCREYHATSDGYQQAYLVAQYLGRLYTLQQLFPTTFTNDFVKSHLGANQWMYEWYLLLSKYNQLADAYEHFDEMRYILLSRTDDTTE